MNFQSVVFSLKLKLLSDADVIWCWAKTISFFLGGIWIQETNQTCVSESRTVIQWTVERPVGLPALLSSSSDGRWTLMIGKLCSEEMCRNIINNSWCGLCPALFTSSSSAVELLWLQSRVEIFFCQLSFKPIWWWRLFGRVGRQHGGRTQPWWQS